MSFEVPEHIGELSLTLASTPGQVELARRQAVLEFFAGAPHSHAR